MKIMFPYILIVFASFLLAFAIFSSFLGGLSTPCKGPFWGEPPGQMENLLQLCRLP